MPGRAGAARGANGKLGSRSRFRAVAVCGRRLRSLNPSDTHRADTGGASARTSPALAAAPASLLRGLADREPQDEQGRQCAHRLHRTISPVVLDVPLRDWEVTSAPRPPALRGCRRARRRRCRRHAPRAAERSQVLGNVRHERSRGSRDRLVAPRRRPLSGRPRRTPAAHCRNLRLCSRDSRRSQTTFRPPPFRSSRRSALPSGR